MIGIGLGVAQIRGNGVATAPDYVEPVGDDPVAPPVGEPEPPTTTPTDPETDQPEPGFDPDFTLPDRIEIADSGQTAVRTTNDPGTFGAAYIATPVSGNEYWEYQIQNGTPKNATFAIGITTLDMPLNGLPGERATEIAWWSDGTIRQNDATLIDLGSAGALARGDLAGIAINDSGEVFLYKNCTALNAGATVGTLAPVDPIYPFVALYSARTRINMNFSLSTFGCTVPDGFYPLGQVPLPTIEALTTVGSGTWTVPAGVSVLNEVLIVAGGGGGGSAAYGGGGGAGGIIHLTNVSVTPGQEISYTVGDGGDGGVRLGTGDTVNGDWGDNGQDSVFGANTAIGGGGGGASYGYSYDREQGQNGGSGGGAPRTLIGLGTAGQGNDGGTGTGGFNGDAGGGGGYAAAGQNAVNAQAGAGGAGGFFETFAAYGDSGYFGGGGGGGVIGGSSSTDGATGAGGIGGGGDGGLFANDLTAASTGSGQPGMDNTGGGGGGPKQKAFNNAAYNGGKGGSGVILIKY